MTAKLEAAKIAALKKIDGLMEKFVTDFPNAFSVNGVYAHSENRGGWTQCFYTGMLFVAYELTGDEKYLEHAKPLVETFIKRVDENIGMGDHDIGFDFSLSTVAAYKLTGDERYRTKSIDAARVLANRFREKGDFIQIAGEADCSDPKLYRLIIDCLMNINLLYWAAEETGEEDFRGRGFAHFNTTMRNVIREDGSSFQNFFFDQATGAPLGGGTKQGLSETSCWSRGQAWGVIGVPLTYSYMKNDEILDKYYKIVNYYLSNLPTDKVAYWDLDFIYGDEPRDTSAAAIAVCGLHEAVRTMPLSDEKKMEYKKAADEIMLSLIEKYRTEDGDNNEGLLKSGTYYYAGSLGINECCIFGDYFYMEALIRYIKPDWMKYW